MTSRHKPFLLFGMAFVILVSLGSHRKEPAKSTKPKQEQLDVQAELDRFELAARSLELKRDEQFRQITNEQQLKTKRLRTAVLKRLNRELDRLTKSGNLDAALQLRTTISQFQAGDSSEHNDTILSPHALNSGLQDSAKPRILGTWRWGNGVDIMNLQDGRTNGEGTWKLLDEANQIYEFQWKNIPADRVQLSANGRVLEGTKAHNPKVRVWAVRVD